MDIIITLPKSVKWSDYKLELQEAENGALMNFKVPNMPNVKEGDKCYVVHDGYIRGFMFIKDVVIDEFKCTTTGKDWYGTFIRRTGKFFTIEPFLMKGFQGYRYVTDELKNQLKYNQ